MWLTEGSASPMFLLLILTLVAAALRWPWPGTLWTGAAALAALGGLGLYSATGLGDPGFELDRFVLRSGSLVVAAVLLGHLGASRHRLDGEVAGLAARPRGGPLRSETRLGDLLGRAAAILAAPRMLLVWEEPDEPWLELALWTPRGLETWREAPGAYEPLVAAPLAGHGFVCADVSAAEPAVERAAAGGLAGWRGAPLHPGLCARLGLGSVVAAALDGDGVSGLLLALDKPRPDADDLALAEAVARQAEADLGHLYFVRRLREAAASEERVRLARDLHDGVMQSLGGAALRLETARRLVTEDPRAAEELMVEIEDLLIAEQQDLRGFVRDPAPGWREPQDGDGPLAARLDDLCRRIERNWGLAVELTVDLPEAGLPAALAHEVDRILREALVNAAKHGRAAGVKVEVVAESDWVRITVADDGHGFPFRGDYDFEALRELKLGPVTLKQRVAAAGGSLRIRSGPSGARLDVRLPLA
jgi:signal transduction histidine kinase